jgi:hypothetical protein
MSDALGVEPFVAAGRRIRMFAGLRYRFVVPIVLVLFLAGCAEGSEKPGAEAPEARDVSEVAGALCALEMSYHGARYVSAPKGPPDRSPALTGRTATATLPACDDGGGDGQGPEDVQVSQIDGVPLNTAFWWDNTIMLRSGAALPESLDALYQPPVCRFPGQVQVTGRWLGVTTSKKVRFDGDLRTPLRIELYVEKADDPTADLEGYTIRVHDDGDAQPALDKTMAEQALWSSRAALKVALVCNRDAFQAASFGTVPR